MTEAAKTTTKKPAPKVEAKDRPAPVQTSNLIETLFFGGMTVAFFAIFASIIFYTVG